MRKFTSETYALSSLKVPVRRRQQQSFAGCLRRLHLRQRSSLMAIRPVKWWQLQVSQREPGFMMRTAATAVQEPERKENWHPRLVDSFQVF